MSFEHITTFVVAHSTLAETYAALRVSGEAGTEGMVLWAGRRERSDRFRVTEMIVPRQIGYRTDSGVCVVVDGDELHRINVYLHEHNLTIAVQVHSHPTEAYHSDTDDELSVMRTLGGLSVVVPDFAAGEPDINNCACYRLLANGWQMIAGEDLDALFAWEE